MPILPKHERYAFKDPEKDPVKKFPAVMKDLKAAYPDYDFVWDRQKERWLCIRWLSWPAKTRLTPIYFVEWDNGTYRDPDTAFVQMLLKTDITKAAGGIKQYLDRMDAALDEETEKRERKLDEHGEYATRPWMDYVRKNSSTTSSVAGWRERHLLAVRDAAQASLAGVAKGETDAKSPA